MESKDEKLAVLDKQIAEAKVGLVFRDYYVTSKKYWELKRLEIKRTDLLLEPAPTTSVGIEK
ncbi:MAG: hypothetical protein LBG88_00020 [Christensenellaceae bacterium]|nr:hypothetical protein [Christensenellaceae bacterium]